MNDKDEEKRTAAIEDAGNPLDDTLCIKCHKNKKYERYEKTYRLCPSCILSALGELMDLDFGRHKYMSPMEYAKQFMQEVPDE